MNVSNRKLIIVQSMLLIVLIASISVFSIVQFNSNSTAYASTSKFLTVYVSPSGPVTVQVNQTQLFTVSCSNTSFAPFSYIWTDENGSVLGTSQSFLFSSSQAFVSERLYVAVTGKNGERGYASVVLNDPYASSGIYLDSLLSGGASIEIQYDGVAWWQAINSNGQQVSSSATKNTVEQYAVTALTSSGGLIILRETTWDPSVSIPSNIAVLSYSQGTINYYGSNGIEYNGVQLATTSSFPTYPYGNLTGAPSTWAWGSITGVPILLYANGSQALTSNWNMGATGTYGISGLSWVNATNVYITGTGTFGNIQSTQPIGAYSYMIYQDPSFATNGLYDAKAANGTICWSSTNATNVFQSAWNAGGEVVAVSGAYNFGGNTLFVSSSNFKFSGSGASTVLNNVWIDYLSSGPVIANTTLENFAYNGLNGLNVEKAINFLIQNVYGTATNPGLGCGINTAFCSNGTISNSFFNRCGDAGVWLDTATTSVKVIGCTADNNYACGFATAQSPKSQGGGGNIIMGCTADNEGQGIGIYCGRYCIVEDNTCINDGNGIGIGDDGTNLASNNLIEGNIVMNSTSGEAISDLANGAGDTISGNSIGYSQGDALFIQNSAKTVEGNTIFDSMFLVDYGDYGIVVSSGCSGSLIEGNNIYSDAGFSMTPINIANATGVTVEGNLPALINTSGEGPQGATGPAGTSITWLGSFASDPTAVTPALVQGPVQATASSGNTITQTVAAPSTGQLGVDVIGVKSSGTGTLGVSSITESGVTWVQAESSLSTPYAGDDIEVWYTTSILSGAGTTITVTLGTGSGTNVGSVGDVGFYSGMATTGVLDKIAAMPNGDGYGSATITGTTATISQANELEIGGVIAEQRGPQTAPTNGFTLYDGVLECSNALSVAYLQNIVSATGTASSGTTVPATGFAGCIATFRVVGLPIYAAYFNTVSNESFIWTGSLWSRLA
jgi:hypothetical protein